MVFIGIDPGASVREPGAWAAISKDGSLLSLNDWESQQKTSEEICNCLREITAVTTIKFEEKGVVYDTEEVNVFLEHVGAISYTITDRATGKQQRFSQKGTSNFKFGENVGFYKGLFYAHGCIPQEVRPQVWQSWFQLPKKRKKTDKPSLDLARKLFPDADLRLKKHHGRADALLIAEYGRQTTLDIG